MTRTRHDLIDVSTFDAQRFMCACGHWMIVVPWATASDVDARFADHVATWDAAEAELDAVDGSLGWWS